MKKLSIFLISFFLLLSSFTSSIRAQETTQTTIISQDEIIDSDLIKIAQTLIVSGKINGDAYLLGSTVTFDGEVTGDLFALGGVVKVTGKIGQDLRVAGGQVLVDAQIGHNVAIAGGTVDISKNTLIPGSLLVAAGNFENQAPVALGAKMALGRGVINNSIGKDVKILSSEELIFGPDTRISGNLTYRAPKEIRFQKGATVSGETKFIPITAKDKELTIPTVTTLKKLEIQKNLKKVILPFKLLNFLFTFLIGFILLKIFPRYFVKTSLIIQKNLSPSLGWGFLVLILFPFILIFLTITIIGIPVAILFFFTFFLALFLAKLTGSFMLGRIIILKLAKNERRGWALLVGLLIYTLLKNIPFIGWLLIMVLITLSLGSMILSFKGPSFSSPRHRTRK